MENSLLLQYIIIAAIVLAAGYSLVRILIRNFSPKKSKDGKPGCDSNCGCS